MAVETLHSLDDPRVDVYRQLNRTNLTRFSGLFIAEGEKLVKRMLASPLRVHSLLVDERFKQRIVEQLPADVPVYEASRELLEEIVGFHFHRGVLGCGYRPAERSLSSAIPPACEPATLVLCADVQDPENLGGILRSSAALGVDAVVLSPRCADPFSRRVLRVSMGTAFTLPICESPDLTADLRALRDGLDVELIATVLDDVAEPLSSICAGRRVALVFGGEGYGIPPEWVELCQRRVSIPMHRQTDSLNVSVAAGIFIHHFTSRQQSAARRDA